MTITRRRITRGDVDLSVLDAGGAGPLLVLLHGLAGSAAEMVATAEALTDSFRIVALDQRGHGRSTRRPGDLSRRAFVEDVVAVIDLFSPRDPATLVGQSMGAHTAFLTAATHPDLVADIVMLEGHAEGGRPGEAAALGSFFASWPTPFADPAAALAFLGDSPLSRAWIADFEETPAGLSPRFDADVMAAVLEDVHRPQWTAWESLTVPTLVVFGKDGMFTAAQRDELIARRPQTRRADLSQGSHDAHLDATGEWVATLRRHLTGERSGAVQPMSGPPSRQ
ncbi:Pimeloyl-ACP methyl ester carboxylesterase [Microbacterium sp. LKL04]|uniref:alpha/beta fold hydrolase n=1 Tax=unclassified Microbacterium TaxID=2609290 RepID=UPI000875AD8E|nr:MULTISPECIES: alpha/beta hydrolase [unclassified Microbacterium]MDQ1126708.1 pimeloyl-ACP methyl ester carboxylesterase [Microbacterium sp. SORGH_AS_0505]SCY00674.1 Pimeloyl-ACP methyl ester carboxylesterase [Microbacterium sp. LKL04]